MMSSSSRSPSPQGASEMSTMISDLPDDLLVHLLSFLSVDER